MRITPSTALNITLIWTISLIAVLIWATWIPLFQIKGYIPELPSQQIFQNISYDSTKNSHQGIGLIIGPKKKINILDLSLQFKLYATYPYMNLFQTSSGTEGIRLTTEAGPLNSLRAVLYIANYPSLSVNKIIITDHLQKNQNYSLEIIDDYWENTYIYFDQQLINIIHNTTPILSNLIIGNGFNGHRPFFGKIIIKKLDIIAAQELPIYNPDNSSRKITILINHKLFFFMGFITLFINLLASYQLTKYLFQIKTKDDKI